MILAGGAGKRMGAKVSKVLVCLADKPMLIQTIETANRLGPDEIVIVCPPSSLAIKRCLFGHLPGDVLNKIVYVRQDRPLGTGHAVLAAKAHFDRNPTTLLVLPADVPLVSLKMLQDLVDSHRGTATILTTWLDTPTGNGRIILDSAGQFDKIQEEKDCTPEQRAIQLVNAGIYVFDTTVLYDILPHVGNTNAQHEYYITDVFELLRTRGVPINAVFTRDSSRLINVNSPADLERASKFFPKLN